MSEYDLELILPVSNRDKYAQRLFDFKKCGLLNIKDKKVRVDLLVGPEVHKNPKEGWPNTVDVNIITDRNIQETSKIYNYLSSFKPEDSIRSRWFAKFDDDSVNDVSHLVNMLDLEYDHKREYYVVTEFRQEQHRYEDDLLRKMGFERWFRQKNTLWHELEGSIVSQAAMKRIVENKTAMNFMKERSKILEGYSDYCLACASRICKIYPSDAYFLDKNPQIGNFSMFGGHLAHIHTISHDKTPHAFDLLQRMLNKKMHSSNGQGKQLYENILNKDFVFNRDSAGGGIAMIHLNPNGIIEGSYDERIWHITDSGTLEFLASDGTLRIVFDNFDDDFKMIQGYFIFDKKGKNKIINPAKPFIRRLA